MTSMLSFGKSKLDIDYIKGQDLFEKKNYKDALKYFLLATRKGKASAFKSRYLSAVGVAQVCVGDRSGLTLCRNVAHKEDYDEEVFYNLAYDEMKIGHRRQTVVALEQGLDISPAHKGLKNLYQQLGRRKEPVVSFLPRDSIVNKMCGRLRSSTNLN